MIDVRTLNPIDYDMIGRSVVKTGRVVIVKEGPKTGGAGAEIATVIIWNVSAKVSWDRSSGLLRQTYLSHIARCWKTLIDRMYRASCRQPEP